MSLAASASALVGELRNANQLVEDASRQRAPRSIAVSGVLADQLAKELGAGAVPGAVQVTLGPLGDTEVVVRVIAGDPTDEDIALVRDADRRGIDVVLVQLWPQAEWRKLFVLTPFVVECRAGEGFPIREIADRIVEASDDDDLLGFAIPVLRDSIARTLVLRTVIQNAALAALTSRGRPLITFQQMQMVTRLSHLLRSGDEPVDALQKRLRTTAAIVFASGLAFQGVARSARRFLPSPVTNAFVAGAGTWAIAKAASVVAARHAG